MIKIVLIDDHELVRAGFRMILEKQLDMEIIGEAQDGEAGLALIRKIRPDIALVDVNMPGISGMELTERVRKNNLNTHIIIVTAISDAPFPRRLLEAGANGYVIKAGAASELLRAIREVASGRKYIAPDVAQRLALEQLSGNKNASPFMELSARELEVASMVAKGEDMQSIAVRLSLSPKTVATYKYRVYEKLNVNNPVALAHLATVYGVLDTPSLKKSEDEVLA